MKKTIFEEMGGTYIRHGDYLIAARGEEVPGKGCGPSDRLHPAELCG